MFHRNPCAATNLHRLCLLAAAVALTCLPTTAVAQQFRGVWADAFSVGFKSTTQINDLVNRAAAGRYNAIIAEVLAYHDTVGGGHGAYWNSSIVPKALDISGSIDPLAQLVAAAHAQGIQVHAWIVPYRTCSAWPPANNPTLAAHPEWLMTPLAAMGGGPATVGGVYVLDPGSAGAQEYLVSIVRELVTNYEIDGINLDYIRYTQTDAGYPADSSYTGSSLARWQAITGNTITPNPTGNSSWNDFRRRTIDEFVRRLRAEIPSIPNPRQPLRLTADLICFGNAPASFTSSDAYLLHQNWQMWLQRGWLDAGIPMNYKRDHVSNEATWYRNWVNASINWRYFRHMYCGQATYLNTKQNSTVQLNYSLGQGANGVVTYAYDATADENTDNVPEADWNWYTTNGATWTVTDVFTTTSTVPVMPWRDPATATEGTVWGRVTHGILGVPIDNAVVQVGALTPVNTDPNGYYVVTLVGAAAAGTTYSVTVTAPGIAPPCNVQTVNNVLVTRAGVTRVDFDPACPQTGDMNLDGGINSGDLSLLYFCERGPGLTYGSGNTCLRGDFDGDLDLDLRDVAEFQNVFGD